MAMTKTAVDVVADSNHQVLHRIMQLVDTPDYVKAAGVLDPEQVAQLPQTVFADPASRKFPLHTKAAAWLAQTYFDEARHLYSTQHASQVQDKIDKAASYWGIAGQVKQASDQIRATQSHALDELTDADYALVHKVGEEVKRIMPINSAPSVKAAAAHLFNNRMKYPYNWRKLAARKILHKAAELGVTGIDTESHTFLSKAASLGSAIPTHAAEKLANRALMLNDTKDHADKVAMGKLAVTVSKMKDIPRPSVMEKLASIIDRFDRAHKLYRYYDQGVETPEEIVFDLTQKKATDLRDNYVELTTGTVIPFTALIDIKLDKIASVIGNDFAQAVSSDDSLGVDPVKFARIARTLPRDDALLLERALQAAGVEKKAIALADVAI